MNTLSVTNSYSTGDNDIFDVINMSVADIPSVVSSDHALDERLINDDSRQPAGRSSACTGSASRATTKVETISRDFVTKNKYIDPDYASEVFETVKVIQ